MVIIREFKIKMKPGSVKTNIPYFTSHVVSDLSELPDLYDQLIDLNTATELLTLTGEHFMDTTDIEVIEFYRQLRIDDTQTSLMERQRPRRGFPWWKQ